MTALPVPVVFGEALVDAFVETLVPGGAPFNVACHLAAFGMAPLLLSRIGNDAAGIQLKVAARHCGLLLDGVQIDATMGTPQVLVREEHGQHSFHIPDELAFDHLNAEAAASAVASRLPQDTGSWLYHGTLALRAPTARHALATVRAARDWNVFVDLNWRDSGPSAAEILSLLHDVDILKLSETELATVLGWLKLPVPALSRPQAGSIHASLAILSQRTGARWILVTYGSDGAACWDSTGRCHASIAANAPARLVDTVGAGDAFSACILATLLRGRDMHDALRHAVAFASASCGWRGAIPQDLRIYQTDSTTPHAAHSASSGIEL